MNITSSEVEKIFKAAKTKANQIAVPMNIAIVDEGANLKFSKGWIMPCWAVGHRN
jgi:uncharacterized protein GlcG (DUF336 family)